MSSDSVFILTILILSLAFCGDPDLHDVLIAHVTPEVCKLETHP